MDARRAAAGAHWVGAVDHGGGGGYAEVVAWGLGCPKKTKSPNLAIVSFHSQNVR